MEATELGAGPINGDGVVLAEGGDEKVDGGLPNVLDVEVIDNESKHDGFGGVDEETGGVAALNKTSSHVVCHGNTQRATHTDQSSMS